MDLAQTMAEETHFGFHLKTLQQEEQAVPSGFPSTNQHNLTLQATLQRLHAAQVRGFPPYCPCGVHNTMYSLSAAQYVESKKYASYCSAFNDSSPYVDHCEPRPSAAPCCCRLPDAD